MIAKKIEIIKMSILINGQFFEVYTEAKKNYTRVYLSNKNCVFIGRLPCAFHIRVEFVSIDTHLVMREVKTGVTHVVEYEVYILY